MNIPPALRANNPVLIERAARAVAHMNGFEFKGASIVEAAATNPRAYQFLAVALAVLGEVTHFQDGEATRQD